jgi:pimeloyl-ACP methyl ester carboxylesterase
VRRRPTWAALALLAAAVGLWACGPAPGDPSGPVGPALAECLLVAPGLPAQAEAQCGSVAVPEDWADPAGQQISLKIAVAEAVSRTPRADAVFVLAGGPGQSITEVYPLLTEALAPLGQDRDIVLVDQRGTGGSNPLRCTEPEPLDTALALPVEEQVARLQACPGRLDADPRHYTTLSAVKDLEAARVALGYEQVNLLGTSYGTRLALAYLREHPGRVRTLVLDAVVNPGMYLFLDAPRDGQRALDMALERCAADPDCRQAFPQSQEQVSGLFEAIEQAPLELELADPVSGEPLEFSLTRELLSSLLFNLLYAPEAVSLLPLGLRSAAEQGDFAPLLSLALGSSAGLYDGLFYSVTCAEDAPFYTEAAARAQAAGTVFGDLGAAFRQVCSAWPVEPVEAVHAPVAAQVPALLLSGAADPITPPEHAEAVAAMLPNSLHLVVPGLGHGVQNRGCLPRLTADFVEQAAVAGLDTGCAAAIQAPPFFVRLTGPNP